jgi:hypothetical protein
MQIFLGVHGQLVGVRAFMETETSVLAVVVAGMADPTRWITLRLAACGNWHNWYFGVGASRQSARFRPTKVSDRFVENASANGTFGALVPNACLWSSRGDHYADGASCLQSFTTRQRRFLDTGYLALTAAAPT